MWIASTNGFISIVQHYDQPDTLVVRARVVQDLQSIFDNKRILETKEADYRYRVLVKKQEMAGIIVKMIKDIDYPNFKNQIAIHPGQKDKLHAYHEIWEVMADYASQTK
jgi:hypothetical protein